MEREEAATTELGHAAAMEGGGALAALKKSAACRPIVGWEAEMRLGEGMGLAVSVELVEGVVAGSAA